MQHKRHKTWTITGNELKTWMTSGIYNLMSYADNEVTIKIRWNLQL